MLKYSGNLSFEFCNFDFISHILCKKGLSGALRKPIGDHISLNVRNGSPFMLMTLLKSWFFEDQVIHHVSYRPLFMLRNLWTSLRHIEVGLW
ncbi:hypothetical protein Scep_029567 [Stephania cephalantha]|uniref:Uncharacterized protein n=1 Tax=Stephania cephalantha TaxID=152367 RepID=A0AAP0DXZ2_9MAGN